MKSKAHPLDLPRDAILRAAPWLSARFWDKCTKGSSNAWEIVHLAAIYVAMQTSSREDIYERAAGDKFDEALAACVPPASKFPTAQALLDALYENQVISERIWARPEPIEPHDAYSALWKQRKTVTISQLAHDAALFAIAHWSGETLVRLVDTVAEEDPEYNSQDAASAMLLMWPTPVNSEKRVGQTGDKSV